MYKSKFLIFVVVCVVASLFLFGCVDPLDAAKSSPTIKAFLADYPAAEMNVQLMAEALIKVDIDFLVECPNVVSAQYYKVTLLDSTSGLRAFAFIDEGGKVVCAFKEGKVSSVGGEDVNGNLVAGMDVNGNPIAWIDINGNLIDANGNLISVLPSDGNTDIIDGSSEPAVIVSSPETQFESVVCSTLPSVAVRMTGDMLVLTVPFPKELEENLAERGASVVYDSRTHFVDFNGEKYVWCLMSDSKDCTVMITATLPDGASETGAIVLTFEGDLLPFCSGCPPGSLIDTSGGDGPVTPGVNPCVVSTKAYAQSSHGFFESVNATYDAGSANANFLPSSLYDSPIIGQNGSTPCQYRNYYKPVAVFSRSSCKVQFDHPKSCPNKSGSVLCGQCEYTSSEIEHRGECYYCPSGSRCNWGVAGICGGAACISSGNNGGTTPGNYFVSCSNCQYNQSSYNYSGPSYTTCNYYSNLCNESACADIRTNCR